MTRRGWFMAFGAGVCGGLLPACSSTAPSVAPPRPDNAAVLAHITDVGTQPEIQTVAGRPEPPYRLVRPPEKPPEMLVPDVVPQPGRARPPDRDEQVRPVSLPKSAVPAVMENANYVAPPVLPAEKKAPEEPLLGSLRCFLEKRPAEAVLLLEHYDKSNQEVLLALLPLAARLTEGPLDRAGPQDMAAVVEQLDTLADPLRVRAGLVIDRMCFCKKDGIKAFGVYEPLPDDHAYRPGEWVDIYVELRNFSSERRPLPDGRVVYQTRLASTAKIRKDGTVWRKDIVFERDRPDESRTPRHDLFNHCHFCVPEIPAGQYTLEIGVTDEPTGRTVRRTLPFRVASTVAREQ